MPVYNSASYIERAVKSVLEQTFEDFEIVLVDDCSTDGTDRIAAGFAEIDPRVIFFRNRQNRGMVSNWNHCLQLARGEYVRFLFGDDFITNKEALARQIERLDRFPSVSLVSSSRIIVDAEDRQIAVWQGFRELESQGAAKVVQACLELYYIKDGRLKFGCLKNLIGEPSAVMFRRSMALRGFNAEYRQLVDLEMWFHLLRQGNFSYIEEPLVAFRVHEEQQTAANLKDMVHIWEYLSLIKDNARFAYPFLLPPIDRYILMYECHRVIKLNRRDGFYTEHAVYSGVCRIISRRSYRIQLPFFMIILPLYKIAAKVASRILTRYRDIIPVTPLV